jgi:hypothetical protein
VDLYDDFLLDAVLVEQSLNWARSAQEFSSVSTVRYYFDVWCMTTAGAALNVLKQALKNQVAEERQRNWRNS